MRLHTIVTETARKIRKPQSLLGFTLPAGCGLGVGIHAIHHHSRLYPNPSQFRPERFADRPYGPFEFLPFGGGHRRCMGAALSDFEMRLTVATLVSKWNFESLREEEEVRHDLGVGAKFGVPVRISRRAATAAGVDLLLPVRPPSSS
jgi:cytochrome P450